MNEPQQDGDGAVMNEPNEPACGWCDGECTCDSGQVLTDADVKRVLESPKYTQAVAALGTRSAWELVGAQVEWWKRSGGKP